MRTIDLTHPFADGMPVFPGDPPARLRQTATVSKDGYAYFHLESGLHVGTHMEGPAHVFEGKPPLSDLPVERLFGRGRLLDARGRKDIGINLLSGADITAGDAVLVFTGMSDAYGQHAYVEGYPPMTPAFADEIARRGVGIIGVDALSPEPPPVADLDVHRRLMQNGTLIIENLTNLKQLLEIPAFDVIALPARFVADAAYARVLAVVRE